VSLIEAETFLAVLEKRRLSISELARRAGVARPDLSNALHAKRSASLGYWLDVGVALGLSHGETRALLHDVPTGMHGHALNTLYRARVGLSEDAREATESAL
jgi:transcriptional regulator with XRE-family HTH domain